MIAGRKRAVFHSLPFAYMVGDVHAVKRDTGGIARLEDLVLPDSGHQGAVRPLPSVNLAVESER